MSPIRVAISGIKPPTKGSTVVAVADVVAAASDGLANQAPILLAAVALPLAGLAAFNFYKYSQLEYITAAMLSRHVPASARVIQVGGGTKELYYYPKSTIQVSIVGDNINKGLLEQGGIQAQVPTIAKVQSPSSLSFAASNTVDAVVVLRSIGAMSSMTAEFFLAEAMRVLKPGSPLVFVEKDQETLFKYLQSKQQQWEQVEYDVALEGQDPHVVGVAFKSKVFDAKAPRRVDVEGLASKMLSKREAAAASKSSEQPKGFKS